MISEKLMHEELIAAVDEILKDENIMQTFDLSKLEVKSLLKVKVTDKGFDVSPNFQSVGWGENESDRLEVNLSDIGNDKAVLKHELKHALHCMICAKLFRGKDAMDVFQKFSKVVMEDPGFYEWRAQSAGVIAEGQWEEILRMMEDENLTIDDIHKKAVMLGSVLYQHAYFVDPTMCEAVASTSDSGFARLNGKLNRLVGMMVPKEQVIEGYGWKEAQVAFGKANNLSKAMLIGKAQYSREEVFGIK